MPASVQMTAEFLLCRPPGVKFAMPCLEAIPYEYTSFQKNTLNEFAMRRQNDRSFAT
jgi:hypothetical protein